MSLRATPVAPSRSAPPVGSKTVRERSARRAIAKKNPPVMATINAVTMGSTFARTPGNVGRSGGNRMIVPISSAAIPPAVRIP